MQCAMHSITQGWPLISAQSCYISDIIAIFRVRRETAAMRMRMGGPNRKAHTGTLPPVRASSAAQDQLISKQSFQPPRGAKAASRWLIARGILRHLTPAGEIDQVDLTRYQLIQGWATGVRQ
jgi:hypothetical protein